MKNLITSQVDPIINTNTINKEINQILKESFKSRINGSFLIKIKNRVIAKFGLQLFECYPNIFNLSTVVTGNEETIEYDICRIIIGIHRHHSIFLSKEEISGNEKNETYQQQLVEETIEKMKLHQYGSTFYRKKQLLTGDEFLYFPVPYELFALCMKSIELLHSSSNDLAVHYGDIINTALSALTLMENNFFSNAYPLCRVMIELYIKTLILQKHPEAIESYLTFIGYEIEQSCCSQKYPEEFNNLYNQRKYQPSKNKVHFLHYGWLDNINAYNLQTKNRYSINGIFDYLMCETNNVQSDTLQKIKQLYKMCHGYAHGSVRHVKYPLLQYFEISMMIYYVVKNSFSKICNADTIDICNNDPNIMDILDRDFKILEEQYRNRSTENFDLYYNMH